jgi:hypothetical protein
MVPKPPACPLRARSDGKPRSLTVTHGQAGHAADLRKQRSAPLYPIPSKLVMRVRFPSPALPIPGLVKTLIRVSEASPAGRFIAFYVSRSRQLRRANPFASRMSSLRVAELPLGPSSSRGRQSCTRTSVSCSGPPRLVAVVPLRTYSRPGGHWVTY